MTIALIDDEAVHLDALKTALNDALGDLGLDAETIDCFDKPDRFLFALEADRYDIIILDIYMDEVHGIDVARKIREKDPHVALAFCTSSNEFATESYEVDARYYLQKPISKEKVTTMLKRFNLSAIERNRAIRLPDGYRLPLRHILYTEYQNHTVTFRISGQKPHTVYMNQGDAEKLLLAHKDFCVINKGCIVNFSAVKRLEDSAFLMKSGDVLPIARRRLKEIEAAYTAYLFEKMDGEDGF